VVVYTRSVLVLHCHFFDTLESIDILCVVLDGESC
jgi:hypothetical protein